MNKIILLVSSLFLLGSCKEQKVQPIEKYRGKGIIMVDEVIIYNLGRNANLRVKNKDSVFVICVTPFDAQNLKIGDIL
jgi:hypothetical protein